MWRDTPGSHILDDREGYLRTGIGNEDVVKLELPQLEVVNGG